MVTPVSRARLTRVLIAAALVAATAGVLGVPGQTAAPRFYPDDPIAREPESQDASKAKVYQIEQMYEMVRNLFVTPDYKPSGARAGNINTIDEVPDSSWFTNRVGSKPITIEELVKGPVEGAPPDPSHWVLTREKTTGAHPGFTARDAKGDTWFLEFDPPYFAEGATGAVEVATKIFWGLGYHQVESFLTTFDPKKASIDPEASLRRPSGKRTPFRQDDVNAILERVHRNKDGTYRVIAGRLIGGRILGNFTFDGSRTDDPNDIVRHERRRELRALRVFGAWTNLTDLKSANTLDSLVTVNGRSTVKHYLQDVGSTFGMCNELYEWDLSYENFVQGDTTLRRLASFGFALSPWQTVDYVEYPSVGKFEGDVFDPRKWRPQTTTVGYLEMRDDDAFWAARRVVAFSDEMIRAAVHTGQFSNPDAEKLLADVLIKRKKKIAEAYLPAINPIVEPRLDGNGRLTFTNAAVDAGVAKAPASYRAAWSSFDNTTNESKPIAETTSATAAMQAPAGLPTMPGSFVAIDISANDTAHPTWSTPIRTHFRRDGATWKLVGLERLPENVPTNPKDARR